MLPRPTARRVLGILAAVAAVGISFTAGVVAGAGSREPADPAAGTAAKSGVLDDAASQIAGSGLRTVDRETLDAAAIAGMLRAAGDPWGSWADAAGSAGIGVWLRMTDGRVVVARVAPGSPAERAGIRVDDQLRAVDGRSTAGLSAPVVAAALRGAPGTVVAVVTRRGTALRARQLVRAEIAPAGVAVDYETAGRGGPTVVRISIPAFTRGVGRQVRAAVNEADHAADAAGSGPAGVVLDLRGNPGGLLDEAVETASAFLDGGAVVSYTRRTGGSVRLDAVAAGDVRVPLVVLVDGGTASAAEVVAGALQDRGRAVLVGSRTFGKGTVQEPRTLPDGSALELTVARYRTPAGRNLEGAGLEPDIQVAAGLPGPVAERRAVDVLSGLVADTGGGHG
jgi:carboxyl-terminal processing protease